MNRLQRLLVALAVSVMLSVHAWAAVHSLLAENPTVDEVAHMPAGVSYWQTGDFKLYHHNPPLVKLIAALPVVLAQPDTEALYRLGSWRDESQASFANSFAFLNAPRYFELFDLARLPMPLFSVLGGLVVFAWSARLFGVSGGLFSLALWVLCPNVLAHGRLCTSDMAATAIGAGATYLFWRFLQHPGWPRAIGVGVALGLAQLSKFSLVLLYALWPVLAGLQILANGRSSPLLAKPWRTVGQGLAIMALSVLIINIGYGFQGTFEPLGKFEFASKSLTTRRPPGQSSPRVANDLLNAAWRHRVNRFRGTILGSIPVPLPRHYLLGFDEQKLETEGIPSYWFRPELPPNDDVIEGYTVYLNGVMRRNGWWYYYLATLGMKVPEGTLFLVGLSAVLLMTSRRVRVGWADEGTVLIYPTIVLTVMTFFTDINLGLRYILPIFPFIYVTAGRVAPWALGRSGTKRIVAVTTVGFALVATGVATATVHPSYLAYFNWVSGGPDRGAEHLIDSNLDWGQDLAGLRRWLRDNRPGARVGLAYFGQINPSIYQVRRDGFEWFLPPVRAGIEAVAMYKSPGTLVGFQPRLTPGIYAVSATLVRGLPWRFYDPASYFSPGTAWSQAWNIGEFGGYSYFLDATPIAKIGHSIYVYDLSEADCARLNAGVGPPRVIVPAN